MRLSIIKHEFIGNCCLNPYLAVARGTEIDNFKFCSKQGDFCENGEKVAEVEKQQAKERRIKEIMHDWINILRDKFNDKWSYELLHWRNKLTTWEAQMTMSSNTWSGFLKAKNLWI